MGIIAPRANHVKLFINGNYFGLYINVEHIDEEFVKSRFGNNDGNLYKCTYPSDLNFKGSDPDVYKFDNDGVRVYELKTNEETDDYSDLADFIYKINFTIASKFSCELDKIFNVNEYIKIMVLTFSPAIGIIMLTTKTIFTCIITQVQENLNTYYMILTILSA